MRVIFDSFPWTSQKAVAQRGLKSDDRENANIRTPHLTILLVSPLNQQPFSCLFIVQTMCQYLFIISHHTTLLALENPSSYSLEWSVCVFFQFSSPSNNSRAWMHIHVFSIMLLMVHRRSLSLFYSNIYRMRSFYSPDTVVRSVVFECVSTSRSSTKTHHKHAITLNL